MQKHTPIVVREQLTLNAITPALVEIAIDIIAVNTTDVIIVVELEDIINYF